MTFRRAFTILEILVVLAVFALLATLAVISLNSARASMRDAQRLSDISVMRAALSQYWLDKATYPESGGVELGMPGTNTDVFGSAGFAGAADSSQTLYLQRVPTGPRSGEYYRYKGSSSGYSIRFKTETRTDLGPANVYYAHQSGIDGEDVEK